MSTVTATFLFTDIEGSTRLWEREPEAMRLALARHDNICRDAVRAHRGELVKSTGDGIHAVFADPLDALQAVLALQLALAAVPDGLVLKVRCGLHCGAFERRDGDYFGPTLNRAARIMASAHGEQVLVSQALAEALHDRPLAPLALQHLGQVRLRDLAEPERVHQLLHPGLRERFPPLRQLAATPNNLPRPLDSFVGREQDSAELRRLLGSTRLLTLLGMGGIGKSRLSLHVGGEVLDDYADGVWLVELAPLADPLLVPQALASVLGVKESAGASVLDALLEHLRDKTLLVILDNCEHVLAACAALSKQLLQQAAGVRVLATSRDVLQIAGETVYPLATLSVTDAAVRLFTDRARAAKAGFALDESNRAAVLEICRQLDGIPLALEIAAARTRVLSVQAIAARLSDRFKLLVRDDKTVLPRQRTLRALIDWSYELLDADERALFQRLAAFAGGFTLEAAEAVAGGAHTDAPDRDDPDVLDVLARLVEKSLVLLDRDGTRYRMLETVRAYAAEKLADGGDELLALERHADEFLHLADQARSGLSGADQAQWLARLDLERENLLAVHARCGTVLPNGSEQGLRLVRALRPYWLNRGLLDLGWRVTIEALSRPGADKPGLARFRGLSDAGWLAYYRGQYGESRRYLEEGLAIARQAGQRMWAARVLQPLGMACLGQGEVHVARGHLEEAVALAREEDDPRELAAALNALAQWHRLRGEPTAARPLYEESLALARGIGDREYEAAFLLNLAMVSIDEPQRVRVLLAQVLDIAQALGSRPAEQSALEVCAALAATASDWADAAAFYGMAEAMATQTGLQRDPADAAFLAPLIEGTRRSLGEADFRALERAARGLPRTQAIDRVRDWLAAGA